MARTVLLVHRLALVDPLPKVEGFQTNHNDTAAEMRATGTAIRISNLQIEILPLAPLAKTFDRSDYPSIAVCTESVKSL